MTNTPNEQTGLANIAAGLGSVDQSRGVDRRDQPFSANPEVLAERLTADPSLWHRLSNSQKIALGMFEREQEMEQERKRVQDQQVNTPGGSEQYNAGADANAVPTSRQREMQHQIEKGTQQ